MRLFHTPKSSPIFCCVVFSHLKSLLPGDVGPIGNTLASPIVPTCVEPNNGWELLLPIDWLPVLP